MAVYDKSGNVLNSVYNAVGTELQTAYDIDGNVVYSSGGGRAVTFYDDFTGDSLDLTKWQYELGYGRNNELQQYYRNAVTVEDSCLVLTATKLDDTGTAYQSWKSGSIITQGLFYQTYGRFEAKIKFPGVVGAFAAFWLLGNSLVREFAEGEQWTVQSGGWPQCGEVDIHETIPGNTTYAQANLWKYSGGSCGQQTRSPYTMSDWHVYACEWTSTDITFYIDNQQYGQYVFSDYSESEMQAYTGNEAMFMILNLAVGRSGGTPADDTTEMKMYVDWVRVYAPLAE